MFSKRILASVILLLLFAVSALAFDIPEPNGFVTDEVGIFSYEEEMALELRVQEIEDATTAEIGILMISTTDSEDISQLAFDVGNTWGVGKEENDNGLMILVAIDDRAWFMATGYGLEGALPDAITKRIAENNFPYYFRDGLYSDGLLAALADIEGYLVKDPSVIAEYENQPDMNMVGEISSIIWLMILIFVAVAKSVWVALSKNKVGNSVASNVTIFFLGLTVTTLLFTSIALAVSILSDLIAIVAGGGGKGGEGRSSRSSSSSSRSSRSSSSSWGSSSGSSSGGSFGGGSFGGGGSGGRW